MDGHTLAAMRLYSRGSVDMRNVSHMDYRDFLAGVEPGSVDLLLTDPPYAISRKTGFQSVKKGVERFAVSMDFGEWDHAEIDLDALCGLSYAALREGGTAIIWYDLWKITHVDDALRAAGFGIIRLVLWEKTNPVPLNSKTNYLSNPREVAVLGVKGSRPTFHSKYDSGIYEAPIPRHGGKRIHPTQKPVDLFAKLIEKHSNPGDLVVDPFLGSGTTAVAAIKSGRSFSGCDISSAYVDAAQERMNELD